MRNLNPEPKIVIGNFDSSINISYICSDKTIFINKINKSMTSLLHLSHKIAKIVAIISIATICSCTTGIGYTEIFVANFITHYFNYVQIGLEVNPQIIYVAPRYTTVYAADSQDSIYREKFEELAKKYNDVNYDRKTMSWGIHSSYYNVMSANTISRIEIKCLEDIDQQYVSNSCINDLFDFMAYSPLNYIQSGYTQESDHDPMKYFQHAKHPSCYFPIQKPLDEISAKDLVLIGNGKNVGHILFYITPKDKQTCPAWGKKLQLTLYFEDQYPISKDFVFERGEY